MIDPDRQLAFYDPGLGTLPDDTGGLGFYRKLYNFISQATGLGITKNIIDCYAALIRLWRPGDRIFLFGFSRGAYTVRCLASVICLCGIPTSDRHGKPLRRDLGMSTKIATHAVKSVYQHVSSSRDEKYVDQRVTLAEAFRDDYAANNLNDTKRPNAAPYFIGVFDTVAALSDTGSLIILAIVYLALHAALAAALAYVTTLIVAPPAFGRWYWYWFGWIAVWAVCAGVLAYVYTHLKFAWRLPGYHFWDVIHLTSFRQKFYDQSLSPLVTYARHAISIDEHRNDFQRVKWGGPQATFAEQLHKIEPFVQFWFAGNHADIGGGYPEIESRLSDLALGWMLEQANDPRLGDEKLLLDPEVLQINGRIDGMQHDETRTSVFRWAKKTLRNAAANATLHPSVPRRFALAGVQQYDVTAPYRPEPLRHHEDVAKFYANVPLPRTTCWERITTFRESVTATITHSIELGGRTVAAAVYAKDRKREKAMNPNRKQLTPDSIVSCLGLTSLILLIGLAGWIFVFWQIMPWLREGVWHSYPVSYIFIIDTGWIGLQIIVDWIWALPMTLVLTLAGLVLFYLFGVLSAKLYQWASRNAAQEPTPAQTRA